MSAEFGVAKGSEGLLAGIPGSSMCEIFLASFLEVRNSNTSTRPTLPHQFTMHFTTSILIAFTPRFCGPVAMVSGH